MDPTGMYDVDAILAGAVAEEPIKTDNVPNTLTEVMEIPVQNTIEKSTGQKSDNLRNTVEIIDTLPLSKSTVAVDIIINTTPLFAPEKASIDTSKQHSE